MAEFAAHLVAYEPDGARIGPLPRPTKWEASFPHDDDGALTLTYSSLAARGALIERGLLTGLEIAVEVCDHAGVFFEPDGARFVLITRDQDAADQTKSRVLTLPAYSWLTGKARNNDTSALYPEGHAQAGKRGFEAASAGGVLAQLLAENAARGGIPLGTDATASLDSAGVAWAQVANRAYDVGTELRAIRDDLVSIGLADWRTNERTLRLYNPDTILGVDRSATVQLRLGKDVGEAPSTETLEKLVHKVLVRTDNGGTTTVEAVGVPTPWGEWEGFLPIGSVDTEADAIVAGQADVDRNAKVGAQYTRSLTLPGAKHWPFVDYDRGDWITAPTTGNGENVRLQQITLTSETNLGGSIVLNDRILDAELRRAKALAAVTGGASTVSPTGGVTPPDSYAGRTPAAPSGLLLDSDVYVDAGVNRALITASWVGPTVGTDGQPIVAASYGVQWRYGTSGEWSAVLPSPDDQLTIPGLTLGTDAQVRVQAVTASGIAGPFTTPVDITTASDVTAPQAPAAPTMTCRLGVLTVVWNGNPASGTWPADLAHVQVAVGATTTPTTVVGTLLVAGRVQVTGQTYGETRYARLRAIDQSGNVGAWSAATAGVVVVGVSAPDLEADSVTANSIEAGAIDGMVITGALIRTDAGTDRIELDGTNFTTYVGGDPAIEVNPGGMTAYNADGSVKFQLVARGAPGVFTYFDFLEVLNHKTEGIEVWEDIVGGTGGQVGFLGQDSFSGALMLLSSAEDILLQTITNDIRTRSATVLLESGAAPYRTNLAMDDTTIVNNVETTYQVIPFGTPTWSGGPGGNVAIQANIAGVSLAYQPQTNAANGYLTTAGAVQRTSSSVRYKQDIEDLDVDLAQVLALRPRTWRDKGEVAANPETTHRIPGFIAEEVDELGLIEFVTYEEGVPESIQYDRMAAAQHLVLINHEARIAEALSRLSALETA